MEEQIVTVNLEDFDFYELRDPKELHTYIKDRLIQDKMTYIFIDEIQQCEDFPWVAATVRDERTLQRELAPLQKIADHYQKLILTLDEEPEADYEGIRRINVLDWLLGSNE